MSFKKSSLRRSRRAAADLFRTPPSPNFCHRCARRRRRRRRKLIGAPPQKKFRNFINQLIFVALIRPIDFRS
jgi:hypothetical protein